MLAGTTLPVAPAADEGFGAVSGFAAATRLLVAALESVAAFAALVEAGAAAGEEVEAAGCAAFAEGAGVGLPIEPASGWTVAVEGLRASLGGGTGVAVEVGEFGAAPRDVGMAE